MHDVSNAINILDTKIEGKICKTVNQSADQADNCHATTSQTGLLKVFSSANTNAYVGKEHEKVGIYTSDTISKETSKNLNRVEKGVVSSAFAKAHEGAEIVEIRSISTTSVMVNACYDVLTDGLPVAPYGCAGHDEGLRC